MMWFEGYYTEEDEPATIDFGKMAGHLTQHLIDCEANPDKTSWTSPTRPWTTKSVACRLFRLLLGIFRLPA